MNYIQINCPHCGKELPIPDDVQQITCMYCAKSIDVQKLFHKENESSGNFEEYYARAIDNLPNEITNETLWVKKFTSKLYPDAFTEYCKLFRVSLIAFSDACKASENSEATINEFASVLLERMETKMYANGLKKPSESAMFDYSYLLIAFLIPAILEQKNAYAEPLADAFLAKWREKYPKHPLGKSTFEQLNTGFRKKLCYITTAACQTLQKGDNCYELNAFRNFRDNYLLKTENGNEKIKQYYLYAPMIVRAINQSKEKEQIYQSIWKNYLSPCLTDIEKNHPQSCAELYEKMVEDLKLNWL